MANDKNLQGIYSTLKKEGYTPPEYNQFVKDMQDENNLRGVYNTLKKEGYTPPEFSQFKTDMFGEVSAAAPGPAPAASAAAESAAATDKQEEATEGGWIPTEQEKIQMSAQMHGVKQDFANRSKAILEQTRRMGEHITPEGQQRLKAGEFQAQLHGTPTRAMGLSRPVATAPEGDADSSDSGEQTQGVANITSPVPYGVKYVNGKAVTEWLMPDGSVTTDYAQADRAEHVAGVARKQRAFELRMKKNGLDPKKEEDVQRQCELDMAESVTNDLEGVAESLWKEAEEKYKEAREANASREWDNYVAMGGGPEMRVMTASANRHANKVSHMTLFDLQKMSEDAWARVEGQMEERWYQALRKSHPFASEVELRQLASEYHKSSAGWERQMVAQRIYDYAVEQNAPKSTLDFFGRTVANMNVLNSLDTALARSRAGTSGDLSAKEQAMAEYGKNHRVAQVAGTVVGMAIDPVTYVSGFGGSMLGKRALSLGGRFVASRVPGMSVQAGTRLFGNSLTGRLLVGSAGTAGNLGIYEGLKEAENQLKYGGYINPGTGENEGYSVGEMLKSTGHGVIMGAVMGPVSPILGNVADKAVKATALTAGKAGIRAGEVAVSTLAEGTIFSIPEWYANAKLEDDDPRKRSVMDVWTDNMAMMLGFKAQHGIKSAPRVIAELRPIKEPKTQAERVQNQMSFEERVNKALDEWHYTDEERKAGYKIEFSKEEREELRQAGYGELADLFSRDKAPQDMARPKPAEGMIELRGERVESDTVHNGRPEFDGYSSMEALVQDGRVSEAVRAKAYYVLTDRMLPMSTIVGSTKTVAEDGTITVNAVNASGEVVISRKFSNEKKAQEEEARIMRQAELNSVDVGERYAEARADDMVLSEAVKEVAPGVDADAVKRIYYEVKSGNKDVSAEQVELAGRLDEAIGRHAEMADGYRPEAIREEIKEATGVDVDSALRKPGQKRTEKEQAAVNAYLERLFPEEVRPKAEAAAEGPTEAQANEQAEAQARYEQGRDVHERFEGGDPEAQAQAQAEADAIAIRMQEAYQGVEDAFGAESEYYIYHLNENPWDLLNDPELTVEQRDAVLYYINSKAALDGVMDASNEAAERRRMEVEQSVDRRTHKDSGVIIPATMKVDNRKVYIVKGDVAMFADGTGVDSRNSSGHVIVMDAETGKYEFVSPDQIMSVSDAIDPRAELEGALAAMEQERRSIFSEGEKSEAESLDSEGKDVTLQHGNGSEQDNDVLSAGDDGGTVAADSTSGVEGDRDRSDIRVYEEGLAAGGNAHSSDSERTRRDQESERLIGIARKEGQYLSREEVAALGLKLSKPSGESEVYVNAQTGRLYKVKNPYAKAPMKGNVQPEDAIFEHLVHNKYFPETRYQFEGITDDAIGDARIILSQEFINAVDKPTDEQIEAALAEKGLKPEGNYRYGNDEVSVTDVTGDNALLGADGKVYFIDPIIDFKKPVKEILGEKPQEVERADAVAVEPAEAETTQGQPAEATALSRIPVHPESGEPMFESVDAQTGWAGLVEAVGGEADAADIATAQVQQATADLEALKKKPPTLKAPKLKGSPMAMAQAKREAAEKYQRELEQYNLKVATAQAAIEAWTAIQDAGKPSAEPIPASPSEADRASAQAALEAKEEKAGRPGEFRRVMESWSEPISAREYMLRQIASGGVKFRWSDSDKSKTHGVGKHLTGGDNLRKSWSGQSEYGSRKWMIDDVNGLFPEQYVEQVCSDYYQDYERGTDHSSEVMAELMDILLSKPTSKAMYEEARELYSQHDTRVYDEWELEKMKHFGTDTPEEADFIDYYGMTYADYEAEREMVMEAMEEKVLSDEEYSELNSNFAEAYLNQEANENLRKDSVNDEGGIQGVRQGGDGLLRPERADRQEGVRSSDGDRGAERGGSDGLHEDGSAQAPAVGEGRRAGSVVGAGGDSERADNPEQRDGLTSAPLSEEKDEHGTPFVVADDGTTTFGQITDESGLTPAPIKLSEGFHDEATGKGYGLLHMEANHGEQIRKSGFKSVQEFVSYVSKNYDIDNIRVGKQREDGSGTYLIQVTDEHENTLFIELSKDGSYWGVNSGGVFRKGYSHKKETVAKTEPQQPNNAVSSDSSLPKDEQSGTSSIGPNGKSTVSDGKGTAKLGEKQILEAESAGGDVDGGASSLRSDHNEGAVSLPEGQLALSVEDFREAVAPAKKQQPSQKIPKKEDIFEEAARVAKAAREKKQGFEVSEEMRELEEELRKLLGISDSEGDRGDMVVCEPSELSRGAMRKVYAMGVNYAFSFLDNGVTKFDDFARAIVGRLGAQVKPFVKSWYEGAKRVPGYGGEGYTETSEVERYNLEQMHGEEYDAVADARERAREHVAKQKAMQAEQDLMEQRNERRQSRDEELSEADRIVDEFSEKLNEYLDGVEGLSDEEAGPADEAMAEEIKNFRGRLADQLSEEGMDAYDAARVAREVVTRAISDVSSAHQFTQWRRERVSALSGLMRVEGEAYAESPKETAKEGGPVESYATSTGEKVDFLSYGGLRKLEPGEVCYVERRFTQTGEFDFTGSERLESADDVAYIFRQLESFSTEHSFAVITKDGRSHIVQLGMGDEVGTVVSVTAVRAANDALGGADKIFFVHNHPSGVMKPSKQDCAVVNKLQQMLPGVVQDGIIIDTLSGEYCTFGKGGDVQIKKRPAEGDAKLMPVHRFNRQVFHEGYDANRKIESAEDAAAVINSMRLGQHGKRGILVLNNARAVAGSFLLGEHKSMTEMADEAVQLATRFGGRAIIFFGNEAIDSFDWFAVSHEVNRLSGDRIEPLDNIIVTNGLNSESSLMEKKDAAAQKEAEAAIIPEAPSAGKASRVGQIEDFGEVLEGARKDALKNIAKQMDDVTIEGLIQLPLSQAFKRPNLKEAMESGALSESEAKVVDAMSIVILANKKPITGRSASAKRPNSLAAKREAQELETWARGQKASIDRIKEYINGDAEVRKSITEKLAHGVTEEGIVRQEGSFGMTYAMLDEMAIMHHIMSGIDFTPGGKLSPIGLKITRRGSSWYQSTGKNTSVKVGTNLEEALSMLKAAFMLKNGIEGAQLPARSFSPHVTKYEMVPTGEYRVSWFKGSSTKILDKTFTDKASAEAFKAELEAQGKVVNLRELQKAGAPVETELRVIDPIKHEYLVVGEKYSTPEEARAALDADYDTLNAKACEAIMANNQIKRQKKEMFGVRHFAATSTGPEEWGVVNLHSNYGEIISSHKSEAEAKAAAQKLEEAYAQLAKEQRERGFFVPVKERAGEDYRQGKDATAEMYAEAFGFRGVQFGNWTNQRDRQSAMNQAYDGLMDLAKVLGVPTRALSLGGELGLAFGARGSGNALAHYEPDTVVINLTKTRGEGSLAHEWWHALDNYFARRGGMRGGFATEVSVPGMRDETAQLFKALSEAVKKSSYMERSAERGAYWGSMRELTARLFAQWVDAELGAKGEVSPFLSRGVSPEQLEKHKELNWLLYQMSAATSRYGRPVKTLSKEEFMKSPEALRGYVFTTPEELSKFSPLMSDLFKGFEIKENGANLELHEPQVEYDDHLGQEYILPDEEKETPESIDKTTDTDENPLDLRGDTALSQNSDVSDDKVTNTSGDMQRPAKLDMRERVEELSEKLHTPVRIISESSELSELSEDGKPRYGLRERRAKGWWSSKDDGVVVVLPNNVNVADVDNTVVHEVVGHKGLRALIGEERFDDFLGEVYAHASNPIRKVIDKMTDDMVAAEADRLRVRKSVAHERAGEDVNSHYYADMAEARVEAEKKREQYRREATEEYMADLGGRIGSEGFEKMSRDELTLWGKIKAKVQQFLDKFMRGLKIAKGITLRDKDLAYILYKSWKNMRAGNASRRSAHNEGGVFDAAEDAVMRRKTGWDDVMSAPEKRERIEKLRKSKAIEISGEEIPYSPDVKEFKKNAIEYGKTLQGEYVNEDRGKAIQLQRGRKNGGLKELLQHDLSDKAHIQSIAAIPNIIRESIYIETQPNHDPAKNPDVKGYEHYVCGLRIGGEDYTVHSIVAEDKRGNRYYDHKLSHIEKGKLLDFIEAKQPIEQILTPMSGTEPTIRSERKVKELISLLQIQDEGITKRFRDSGMGLEETITRMKAEAMQSNADNFQAKQEAMRAIGGNLNHLRRAMARQREYDITTVKSVSDLARVLMEAGLLDDLSQYETKRILGAINNVVGRQDVSQYVQKVMDIMVDNQLRLGANTLGRLLSIRGSRVDARGIEVQGELDPDGQRIAQVVRKSTTLPKDDIDNRIADAINRMSSSDNTIADEATIEYAGLQIARQYVEDITESKAEEKALRDSIKRAKEDKDAGQMTEAAYKQYVEATNDAIRQNKIDRAEAFHSLVEQVGDVLSGSIERAKAWREAEKQRVEEIHHNANSDMEGRPTDEHHKDVRLQKLVNNDIARFLLAPLATFDQMLRMFGNKNSRGEGYLWNRFMRGWVEATEQEYTGYRDSLKVLDEKVSEVFGKKMTWGDLFAIDRKLPKASVRFWDGGEMKDHELTQGNLLYIYMADKMSDGRMKLRRMGITEDDVENIKNFLDPRFIELADWMQEEFLVDKRNKYNEVHKRMFGASMAAIENYFPLKILSNARMENVDVADDIADPALPATTTGSIIKRRRNNLALDVTGANAFSVILDHLQQMERWAAFAEFNRDLNTLLSYKRFRNQVMNMSSAYGAGKKLWDNFRNVCRMAAGAYRPPIAALDKAAVNIAKGVTAAKVSFRIFTALKQFLSMPAYLSDSNPIYLAANIVNPIDAWNWTMQNLPLFEKRWKSRMAGDPRLLKTDMDWKMWRSRVVELASRVGMSPNAFVDALTVAIGAHSMYQTKLAKYKRQGYDPDVAEQRAKQDATILFNQTQQSSEGAFLSTMQVDRSWLSVLFTVFRNSSMSYSRQLYDAVRNLSKVAFKPGYKGLTEEFMAKQMMRDGIDPEKATKNAKREYRRGIIRDIVRVGIFGYGLQLLWNLGAYLPYLIFGDNEDEKDKMMDDAFNHTMFGSIEGLTGGDVMSAAGNMWVSGEGNPAYLTKDMPLASDVLSILKNMDKDQVAAMNDVINLCVQAGLGVNPESLTDAVVAVMDYCGDDPATARECALLILRVMNSPQSQIDKVFFDEIDASAKEESQTMASEIAERYARYKVMRGAPLTGWAYGNEQREKLMEKYRKRVNDRAKERITQVTDNAASPKMGEVMAEYEQISERMKALKAVKEEDLDRYYDMLDEVQMMPEFDRYLIVKSYKHEVNDLTKQWLNAKSAEEKDSCSRALIALKEEMLDELQKQQ